MIRQLPHADLDSLPRPAQIGDLIAPIVAAIRQQMVTPQQRWLSPKQASAYAGMSERAINHLLASGRLTKHKPLTRKVLIDVRELDSLIASTAER